MPTDDAATSHSIYVGESDYTGALGISTEGLRHGAYRMVSGEGWLALVGSVLLVALRAQEP